MPTQFYILHIEDDNDDVELLQDAFKDSGVSASFDVIREGDKVIPWLTAGNKLPDLIVMDLNLPKMHGRDLLRIIKSKVQLSHIPIVILSTSSSKEDIDYCLDNGAVQFITKPTTAEGFGEAVRIITEAGI
ncbi:MAG TPA: response regulator [Chitinophagales bacterium]|nr:response regulator [Chitinophagales bacterium]